MPRDWHLPGRDLKPSLGQKQTGHRDTYLTWFAPTGQAPRRAAKPLPR